jgi:acetyl/propionyl-CoA carboxylase alpha subunit
VARKAVIRLRCGGERREVRLRAGRDGCEVSVDGAPFVVEVQETAPATFVLCDGDRVETFHCARDGDAVHLFWRGTAYRLEEEAEAGARGGQRHTEGALEAPMPGRVIKVSVTAGQTVSRGDEVLVVEAMKMENALRAPRDGTVRSVAVSVGDMVSPGVVLVELE